MRARVTTQAVGETVMTVQFARPAPRPGASALGAGPAAYGILVWVLASE